MFFKEAFRSVCERNGIKVSDELIEQLKEMFDSQEDDPDDYDKPKKSKGYRGRSREASGKTPSTNEKPHKWSERVFDRHDDAASHNSSSMERST